MWLWMLHRVHDKATLSSIQGHQGNSMETQRQGKTPSTLLCATGWEEAGWCVSVIVPTTMLLLYIGFFSYLHDKQPRATKWLVVICVTCGDLRAQKG